MGDRSFRDLAVYQLSFQLAVEVDRMSKTLPHHELYEVGSQIRRSAKSIPSNLAEGYGRHRYTQDYVRFVVIALASCDETRVHLDMLHETGSIDTGLHASLSARYDELGRKLNRFLQAIQRAHQEPYR